MNNKNALSSRNQAITERNRLLIGFVAAGGLSLLLGFSVFCLVGKERVVIVPPIVNRDFWVGTDTVSDSYLEQMSEFFAGILLNVNPNSFKTRSEHLLQHVAPNAYPALKTQLVERQLELERRAMSTAFYPASFKVDRHKLLVELKGELKILVGNAAVQSQTKIYHIQFSQHQGRLYIQQFREVPHV